MFETKRECAGFAVAICAICGSTPAVAQDAQRVEITGSSIRRSAAETALPVTTIRVEDLARQGVTSVEGAMARLSANQSTLIVSSAVGITTGGKSEVDLRGLSGPFNAYANKTLVLLDGRRIATHAFDAAAVDLNAIPLAAVERIEVLRDGASAIYGTDAIGGVVNFVLKRDYTGATVSAQSIVPQRGSSGGTQRANATFGFGTLAEQRFNLIGAIDWRKQSALEAAQREFSATGIVGGDITGGTSGTSFPGDLGGFEPTLPGCAPPDSVPDETGSSCRYDFSRALDAIPRNEQWTALLRGSVALAPTHTASLEYARARHETLVKVAPTPASHVIPASSPYFPAGAPITNVPDLNSADPDAEVPGGIVNWRQVPGGKRAAMSVTTTDRLLFDLRGSVADYDYRLGIGRSKNRATHAVVRGFLDDDLMQQGVFDGVVNPFGAQTPAGLALIASAQVRDVVRIGVNRLDFFDARISGEAMRLAAGPLNFAFGIEHRRERSFYDTLDIAGALPALGLDPADDTGGRRRVSALYAEVGIPVTPSFEITAAARHDRYSDFGNAFNPKLALRFQATRELLFRASVNSGFRAPTLYDLYQPESFALTSGSYDDPLLCPGGVPASGVSRGVVCGQQVYQRTVGPVGNGLAASALKPEKSRTLTFGFVADPSPAVSLGVDYWHIGVRNLISPLPEQELFASSGSYASRFVRCGDLPAGPGPGLRRDDIDVCLNYPTFDPIAFLDTPIENLGELKTHGIDLSLALRSGATPYGRFVVGLEGTYVLGYKYQRQRGGAFIEAAGRYSDSAPVFRWQHTATLNWTQGPWSTTLTQRFKSGYRDEDPSRRVASYVLHDLSVAWTGVPDLTLMAGIANLFDRQPPLTLQSFTFQRGYDPRFADPLGRSFWLYAEYRH